VLHYFHRRSRGENADFLELSPDQVAYRLRSARRLFKEHLTKMSKNKPSDSELAAVGKDAFKQIGDDDAHLELARCIGLLGEHISLGLVAKDGSRPNVLRHSLEVAELTSLIAERLGLDPAKARRAGLLHDLGKVLDDHRIHSESGAQKAADLGEDPEVVAAIADHHERGERLADRCFQVDISPLCFALVVADFISAHRFEEGAPEGDPEKLVEQLVELDGGDLCVHGYLFGGDVRVLVQGAVENERDAALHIADQVRTEMGFSGRVRITFAPG
jgi:ribonuclease Y